MSLRNTAIGGRQSAVLLLRQSIFPAVGMTRKGGMTKSEITRREIRMTTKKKVSQRPTGSAL